MKYYEIHRSLILACTLAGVYFPGVEKIYGNKRILKMLKFIFILPGTVMPFYCICLIKYQIMDEDELGNKIYGSAVFIFVFLLTFTYYALFYYRNDFVRVFELWDSLFQEELFSEDRQALLMKNRKVTNKWLKISGSTSVATSVLYCIVVFLKSDKQLNHPSGLPYRHQSPDFELANTVDLITASFGFFSLITFDSMTMTFLSMEEAQLKHLKTSLAKIVGTLSVTEGGRITIKSVDWDNSKRPQQWKIRKDELTNLDTHSDTWKIKKAAEEVDKKLRIWISHHHQLLRFHDEFHKVFTVPLSFKFMMFVLMLCFSYFLMLTGKYSLLEVVSVNVYCLLCYSVFYANTRFADSIEETASTIFEGAFAKSWYLYPKNLKVAFHIIQMNSHRPLLYMAFKNYSLSSKSFLKILSSAYSLFTFLLQTNRKKMKSEYRATSFK